MFDVFTSKVNTCLRCLQGVCTKLEFTKNVSTISVTLFACFIMISNNDKVDAQKPARVDQQKRLWFYVPPKPI